MRKELPPGLLIAVLAVVPVLGHVPDFPGDNAALDRAKAIDPPSKSWAVYGSLNDGMEPQYYSFMVDAGDRIKLQLLISTDPDQSSFVPDFALLGPGLPEGDVPDYVSLPDGYGAIVVEGTRPEKARYEGFSPSSYYDVGGLDIPAASGGTHYVAVYSPRQGGRYSLVVGYVESFSLAEWTLVPVNMIAVYRWSGQGLTSVLAPMVTVVLAGLALSFRALRRRPGPIELLQLPVILAGLTYLGSTATIIYQMAFTLTRVAVTSEVIITLGFALLPLVLAVGALKTGLGRCDGVERSTRIRIVMLGVFGLLVWAGMIIGPALAILAGLLPSRRVSLSSTRRPGL